MEGKAPPSHPASAQVAEPEVMPEAPGRQPGREIAVPGSPAGSRRDWPAAPRTFVDLGCDGLEALKAVLAASEYRTLSQAAASLTLFSHPDTVRQTSCKPLFKVIRNAARRGQIEERAGELVACDDNKAPTDAFLWCNGLRRRPRETQFNHVYADSQDPDAYTCLANLCMTPSFLAKLTDTNAEVCAHLRYRTYELYGWHPAAAPCPKKPVGYDALRWPDPLPPVADVAAVVAAIMARRPRDRTVQIARRIGWLFNGYRPSAAEPANSVIGT
jgi:hypothetical protein